jgi:hypothetical protein
MKRGLLAAVVLSVAVLDGYADMPVIDFTNIIASIENGFTLYEQVQQMYNQLETSYRNLEQTIKGFEAFDFNNLDPKDPLGTWRNIMTYGNRQMNLVNNIERIMNTKNMKIGNQSFSLSDIYSNPSNVVTIASKGVDFVVVDPFERELTDQEKARFHQRYGMSYGNYMRYAAIGNAIDEKAQEIMAFAAANNESLQDDAEKLDGMGEQIKAAEGSQVKQGAVTNALLQFVGEQLIHIKTTMGNLAAVTATIGEFNKTVQEKMEKIGTSQELNISENIINAIKVIPPHYK